MQQLTPAQVRGLIISFARIETLITKQTNSRRGVTNKAIKEERSIVKNLLDALLPEYTDEYLADLLNNLS